MLHRLFPELPWILEFDKFLFSRRRKEEMTPHERDLFDSFLNEALTGVAVGLNVGIAVGACAAFIARPKVPEVLGLSLIPATAIYLGLWMLGRPHYAFADRIFAMDGSILRNELANITLRKYQDVPLVKKLISNHFYFESIFDDSTSDSPKLRWRFRNFFSDSDVHVHRTHDHESYEKSQGGSKIVTSSKRTNLETKHNIRKADPDVISEEVDDLDCLFGYAVPEEVIQPINSQNKPPGKHNRSRRRLHRRRLVRNHEDVLATGHAAAE